jgi:hypothetical protein
MRRAAVLVALACVMTSGVQAYLKLGKEVGSIVLPLKWTSFPIRYAVTERDAPGVSAADLQLAVRDAFQAWDEAPHVEIAASFDGFTDREPFSLDGQSVVGFRSRPDLDDTLGATTFSVDAISGELLEADVFLNTAFNWSTSAGEASRFDVQAIVLHEIGHLLGLGHSALGETELLANDRRRVLGKGAVMFPLAFPAGSVADRTPQRDDLSGLFDIYGSASGHGLGSISGRVTLNNAGVFGAHVTAFDPRSGHLVGGFTLTTAGDFVIAGLEPGLYVVRAEPLDDADLDSILDDAAVRTDFKPAFAADLVSVPGGGTSERVQIQVSPK